MEYIGNKSKQGADDYVHFLEECGYRVFFKNINLNYSVGKIEARPWADKGGKFATSSTTLHRELLIVEKKNDGKSFVLHTTYEDKLKYYKTLQRPWLFGFLIWGIAGLLTQNIAFGVLAVVFLVVVGIFHMDIMQFKKKSKETEW